MSDQAARERVHGDTAGPGSLGARLPLLPLLDASSDAVLAFNMHRKRIYANAVYQRLTGRPISLLIGEQAPFPDWGEATEESFALGVREAVKASSAGRPGHRVASGEIVHVSGQSVPVTMEISLVLGDDDGAVAVVAIVRPRGRVPWLDRRKNYETDTRVLALEGALRAIAGEVARLGVAPIGVPNVDSEANGRLRLSQQEWRIVQAILEGRRVATIARNFHLSEHTVRNHLKNIFRKVNVRSQAELVERFNPAGVENSSRLA
jgi:DNA-binding CsgD family transcriptional regulator